ncbi:MAG: DUF348 domain-containing protein [Chloroflexi bacterium]|nr:DUF348 domain-containing protein [Chloroflexota bacterium]
MIPHGGPALTEVVAGGIRRSVTGPAMLTDTGEQIGAGQVVVPPRAVVPGSAPMRAAPLVLERLGHMYGDVVDRGSPSGGTGRIVVQRATPFRLSEDGITEQVRAAASTVGEALRSVGIDVDAADVVVPTLEAPLMPGLRVSVMRAPAVTVAEGGSVVTTRTSGAGLRHGPGGPGAGRGTDRVRDAAFPDASGETSGIEPGRADRSPERIGRVASADDPDHDRERRGIGPGSAPGDAVARATDGNHCGAGTVHGFDKCAGCRIAWPRHPWTPSRPECPSGSQDGFDGV